MRGGLSDQRLGQIGVAGVLVTVVFVLAVAFSSISGADSPVLNLPPSVRHVVADAAPQGWQFFTKDAQAANILPFRKSGGHWVSIQRNGALHGALFGFDRVAREQGIEVGVVESKVPTDAWLPCKVVPERCLAEIPVELQVSDTMPHPTLCGDVGLANQAPVPWAWARLNPVPVMPSTIVRIDVTCPT